MELNIANNKPNIGFTSLNRIKCIQSEKYGCSMCTHYERRVVEELRALAEKNNFFKDYDVDAIVNVERWSGSLLSMRCKPAAKTFKDKVKNFFSRDKKIINFRDSHSCPDDSSFMIAKKLRGIGTSDKLYRLL